MTITELTNMLSMCFELQNEATQRWHNEEPQSDHPNILEPPSELLFKQIILAQHLANFQLWHIEDIARRRDVSLDTIADCKYRIDSLNQKRNDHMEHIDHCFLQLVQPLLPSNTHARLNTESIGMAVDRTSILSLKVWHMNEQAERIDVMHEHLVQCKKKFTILNEQRKDLINAIIELIHDFHQGTKKPKLYYQYKMYNDPTLNPELYQNTK